MMRLLFTCVSGVLIATAAALWWVQHPPALPAEAATETAPAKEPLSKEVAAHPAAPDLEATPIRPEQKTIPGVETPQHPEIVGVIDTEVVKLDDPGDFVPDPGPSAETSRVAAGPPFSEDAAGVHVDVERSAGWVQRLLALYEVVGE